MPELPSLEGDQHAALADGFDEVVECCREPGAVLDAHTHLFALETLVMRGEIWLDVWCVEMLRLLPGDSFSLEREVPQAERCGDEGARYGASRTG